MVHVESLPKLQALVNEAVCSIEAYMTIAERDIKLHELQQMPGAIGRMGEWYGAAMQVGVELG